MDEREIDMSIGPVTGRLCALRVMTIGSNDDPMDVLIERHHHVYSDDYDLEVISGPEWVRDNYEVLSAARAAFGARDNDAWRLS